MAKHMTLVPLKKDPRTGAVTRRAFDPEVKHPNSRIPVGCKSVPAALGRKLIRDGNFELVEEWDDGQWSPEPANQWDAADRRVVRVRKARG